MFSGEEKMFIDIAVFEYSPFGILYGVSSFLYDETHICCFSVERKRPYVLEWRWDNPSWKRLDGSWGEMMFEKSGIAIFVRLSDEDDEKKYEKEADSSWDPNDFIEKSPIFGKFLLWFHAAYEWVEEESASDEEKNPSPRKTLQHRSCRTFYDPDNGQDSDRG